MKRIQETFQNTRNRSNIINFIGCKNNSEHDIDIYLAENGIN